MATSSSIVSGAPPAERVYARGASLRQSDNMPFLIIASSTGRRNLLRTRRSPCFDQGASLKNGILLAGSICLALFSAMCSANAQKVTEKPYKNVGDWKIIANFENTRLDRCIAERVNSSGALRIALHSEGKWAASFPGFGGNSKHIGSAKLNKLHADRVEFQDFGGRAAAALAPNWVQEMKRGGTLYIDVNRKEYRWQLNDAGRALAEVENCMRRDGRP